MRQSIDNDDGSALPHLSAKGVLRHNYLFRGLADSTLEKIAGLAAKRV